jgi:hypothetical protein
MKLRVSIVISFVLTATLLGPHARAQSTQKAAEEVEPGNTKLGSITGRVLADGQPVNNASIIVSRLDSTGPSRAVPTNDAGDFEVKGLEPGVYRIRASAPGYVSPPTDSDEETYYRVGDSLRLTMTRGAVITGKVLAASDEPVVAIRVRATMIRDVNGKSPTTAQASIAQLTDDRGIYRIYGLLPGTYVVSAGGRGSGGFGPNAYDNDAPTYSPSSTRDTAVEMSVGSGEEKTANIRYRGDTGHAVSGTVIAPITPNSPWISIYLARLIEAAPDVRMSTSQGAGSKGFEFYGVADGEYLVWAQYAPSSGETFVSEPRRITVKGAEVTGIELTAKPLATVAGELVLEPSTAEACKEKRRPLFDETLVAIQRNPKATPKDQPQIPLYNASQASPDKSGSFVLRNLTAGQYSFDVRFFARYWYLRSIDQRSATATSKEATNNQTDVARTWFTLKSGDRDTGLKVTLAGGAASLAGQIILMPDQKFPLQMSIYLIPAEKEKGDDVLRFFAAQVEADGSFALDHLPPGRYLSLAKITSESELTSTAKLRLPGSAEARTRTRREAEGAKFEVELKPCQNVNDYKLPLKSN